jgi:hypothetical protein
VKSAVVTDGQGEQMEEADHDQGGLDEADTAAEPTAMDAELASDLDGQSGRAEAEAAIADGRDGEDTRAPPQHANGGEGGMSDRYMPEWLALAAILCSLLSDSLSR